MYAEFALSQLAGVQVVQRLLHDAEDAAPAGPRSIGQQLDDVRDQVSEHICSILHHVIDMLGDCTSFMIKQLTLIKC